MMEGFLAQRPNLDSYAVQAAQVFSTESLPLNQVDIKAAFKNLQKTYCQYIRSWWEITSLDTYIQQKLIYRGLRINLSPSTHSEDIEFVRGWQDILTTSSIKLLEYLVEWERKYFILTTSQLEKEISDIQIFRPHPDFEISEKRLQSHIESFQTEIRERKHKKYIRDKRDFDTGQIYNIQKRNFPNKNRQYTDISESDKSETDESVSGTVNNYRQKNTYRNKNKRTPYQNYSQQNKRPPGNPQHPQKQTWQNQKSSEEQRGANSQPSDFFTLPSTLSSVLQLAPTVTNSIAHMAPPITMAPPTVIPPNAMLASGGGQQNLMNQTMTTQLPPFSSPFLGPPGVQLRDREKWAYQGKLPT